MHFAELCNVILTRCSLHIMCDMATVFSIAGNHLGQLTVIACSLSLCLSVSLSLCLSVSLSLCLSVSLSLCLSVSLSLCLSVSFSLSLSLPLLALFPQTWVPVQAVQFHDPQWFLRQLKAIGALRRLGQLPAVLTWRRSLDAQGAVVVAGVACDVCLSAGLLDCLFDWVLVRVLLLVVRLLFA